jgi:hypothetical protein
MIRDINNSIFCVNLVFFLHRVVWWWLIRNRRCLWWAAFGAVVDLLTQTANSIVIFFHRWGHIYWKTPRSYLQPGSPCKRLIWPLINGWSVMNRNLWTNLSHVKGSMPVIDVVSSRRRWTEWTHE